jgi:hypothetical protein
MTTAVARDPRRPIRPPESVAANLTVRWVRRWEPVSNYGYFELGRDTYRVTHQHSDTISQTWHVAKVMPDYSTAIPYTVTLPVCGSGFAASCDCKGFFHRRECRHVSALTYSLEHLGDHDGPDDEIVERTEREGKLARLGESAPF